MMISQSRRERLREATLDEIKQVALGQMAEQGAAALSLRGIAATMRMSTPALYNYFKSRDDLVTTLILDAYTSLGDATIAAAEAIPAEDYGGRFLAAAMATREWARAHREEFSLIYGSPIPGYHAPIEVTTPASVRANDPFIKTMEEGWRAGQIKLPAEYKGLVTQQTKRQLEKAFGPRGYTLPEALLQIAMGGWATMQGLLSLELYGHFDALCPDISDLYYNEIIAWLTRLGVTPR